jgi:hypothetical protein
VVVSEPPAAIGKSWFALIKSGLGTMIKKGETFSTGSKKREDEAYPRSE